MALKSKHLLLISVAVLLIYILWPSNPEEKETAKGYELNDLVRVIIKKNLIFRDQLLNTIPFKLDQATALRTVSAVGMVYSRLKSKHLRVVDFGGGGGYHYFIAKAVYGKHVSFEWTVFETNAMVHEAKDNGLETNELRFSEFDLNRKAIDLIIASSSLQYSSNHPLESLNKLLLIKPKYFYITRTPLSLTETFTLVQKSYLSSNGPGPMPAGFVDRIITYPATFVSKAQLEDFLVQHYIIEIVFSETEGSFTAGKNEIGIFGYFCSLRD